MVATKPGGHQLERGGSHDVPRARGSGWNTTASLVAVDARRITKSVPTPDMPGTSPHPAAQERCTANALPSLDSRRVTTSLPAYDPQRASALRDDRCSGAPLAEVFGRARPRGQGLDPRELEQEVVLLAQLCRQEPRDIEVAEAHARALVDASRPADASHELLRLARLYTERGQHPQALQAIEHARQLDPASLVRPRLAPLLPTLGAQGRRVCERAIEGHLAAARLVAARDLLVLLVEVHPGETELRHRLAKTELLLGHTGSALGHLQIVIERYRAEQHVTSLVVAIEEVLRHGGADPDLLWELTLIYLQADLHERALEKLEQLHRLLPGDLEIVERMANLQARLGRFRAAEATMERLISAMRVRGLGSHDIEHMLARARHWNDSPVHRRTIDALAHGLRPG